MILSKVKSKRIFNKNLFSFGNKTRKFYLLNEQQNEFKNKTREFVKNKISKHAEEHDKNSKIHYDRIYDLGNNGYLSMLAKKEYGGEEVDAISYLLALEEIGFGCSSLALITSMTNAAFIHPLQKYGTENQIQLFIRPIVGGKSTGCFAYTEHNSGDNAQNFETKAICNGRNYIINGTKSWVTNSNISSAGIIFAKTKKDDGNIGVSAFLVPFPHEGLTIGNNIQKMGTRGVYTSEVILKNCSVSNHYLLGEEHFGFEIGRDAFNLSKISTAAVSIGISKASFLKALKYTSESKYFGKTLHELDLMKEKIAEMHSKIEASKLLVYRAAYLFQQNLPYGKEASIAKFISTQTSKFVTQKTLEILGKNGYSLESNAERHFRDAMFSEIYSSNSDIQKILISSSICKEYQNNNDLF